MEEIKVTISSDGSIEYSVKGVKGGKCVQLTKAIDEISGQVMSREKTGEFCEVESKQQVQNKQ